MAKVVTFRTFTAHRYAKSAGYRLECRAALPNGALVIVAPGTIFHLPDSDVLPVAAQLLKEYQASRPHHS